eukprot:CAMPEP_0197467034 /NCGR_PEP_ID=MMETSP1175-20131217/65360_1 /TAXON_ID=1003142 /ORGANISM="Triceratium dubium, Strain CCMP147" /LENGTH=68 /DNA_ID=CAMNT_0043003095 /DNA_START=1663 /DNA_END=1866 /DNA_ORIENTATION=+
MRTVGASLLPGRRRVAQAVGSSSSGSGRRLTDSPSLSRARPRRGPSSRPLFASVVLLVTVDCCCRRLL